MKTESLALCGVCRYFDNKPVLNELSLHVYLGELVLVIGRSGSGKSVLAKIMTGQMAPDRGAMWLARQSYSPRSLAEAFADGVAYIGKDGGVMENLSIAENICLTGAQDYCGLGFAKKLQALATAFCREYGEAFPMSHTPERLTRLMRLKVQLLRAKFCGCRLIVMDGVLNSLTEADRRELLGFLQKMRDLDMTVVLLDYGDEAFVFAADRVLLLQNGCVAADCDTAVYPPEQLQEAVLLFHRAEQSLSYYETDRFAPQAETKKLCFSKNLQVAYREGEAIGMWATSTADFLRVQALVCARRTQDGLRSECERILLLTEDALQRDYFLDLSVSENLTMPSLRRIAAGSFFLNRRRKSFAVQEYGKFLSIDRVQMGKPLRCFSQRQREEVVLFRLLAGRARHIVLSGIVDERNRSRQDMVLRFIRAATQHRKTIFVLGQNLDVLEALCDRIMEVT